MIPTLCPRNKHLCEGKSTYSLTFTHYSFHGDFKEELQNEHVTCTSQKKTEASFCKR